MVLGTTELDNEMAAAKTTLTYLLVLFLSVPLCNCQVSDIMLKSVLKFATQIKHLHIKPVSATENISQIAFSFPGPRLVKYVILALVCTQSEPNIFCMIKVQLPLQ